MAVKREKFMKAPREFFRLMLVLVVGLAVFLATARESFGCCVSAALKSDAASRQSASELTKETTSEIANHYCCSSENSVSGESCCCSGEASPGIGVVAISGCQTQAFYDPQRTGEVTRLPDLATRTFSSLGPCAYQRQNAQLAYGHSKERIYILHRQLLI